MFDVCQVLSNHIGEQHRKQWDLAMSYPISHARIKTVDILSPSARRVSQVVQEY